MAAKEMNAGFAGQCQACGGDIAVGDRILWSKAEGSRHKACPAGAAKPRAPADIPAEVVVNVRLSRRSRPTKDSEVGRILRTGDGEDSKVVRVLAQTAVFIAEDGESLGLDFDRGWRLTLHCRLATAEESAPIEAAERAEAETIAKERATDKVRRALFAPENGEYLKPPEGQTQMCLRGVRVKWREGFTIYGGGEEIVVDEDGQYVWWVVNNGADGDCWADSNVMTGGAGAIGRRYPATAERLAFVRSLPGGEFVGLTPAERRTLVIQRYRAQVGPLRPEFDGLFDDAPLDAVKPLPAAWVALNSDPLHRTALVGMTPNGAHIYLAVSYAVDGPSPYDHDIPCHGDGCVYLEYAATPARAAAIRSLWPGWVGTSAPGRYVFRTARGGVCENAADALVAAHYDRAPVTAIEETVNVHIVYALPGVVKLGPGVILWSDGEATPVRSCGFHSRLRHDPRREPWRSESDQALATAGFPAPPEPKAWTLAFDPTADELLGIALRQELWRKDRRFERLFTAVATERAPVEHRGELIHGRSSDEVTLYQLSVRHQDGRVEPFWLVHGRWVDIGGGDADAGDNLALFDDEPLARDAYRSLYV